MHTYEVVAEVHRHRIRTMVVVAEVAVVVAAGPVVPHILLLLHILHRKL